MIAGALMFRMKIARQEIADVQLTALLDAAVARSLASLSVSAGWEGTEESIGEGRFRVEVEERRGNVVVLRAEARWGPRARAARVEVRLDQVRPPRLLSWSPRPVIQ